MRLNSNFLSVVISTSSYNPPFGTRAPFITCKLRAASSIVIFTCLFLSGICSTPFIIIDSILFSCSVWGSGVIVIVLLLSGLISSVPYTIFSIIFTCAPV